MFRNSIWTLICFVFINPANLLWSTNIYNILYINHINMYDFIQGSLNAYKSTHIFLRLIWNVSLINKSQYRHKFVLWCLWVKNDSVVTLTNAVLLKKLAKGTSRELRRHSITVLWKRIVGRRFNVNIKSNNVFATSISHSCTANINSM